MPSSAKRTFGRRTVSGQTSRQRRQRVSASTSVNLPVGYRYSLDLVEKMKKHVDIGELRESCGECKAFTWKGESAGFCCNQGKVKIPTLPVVPELLENLLTRKEPRSQHFLDNIRRYNNAFSMTSLGCTEEKFTNFQSTFKIKGRLYHRIGALVPQPTETAQYLQIYFLDDLQAQVDIRLELLHLNSAQLMDELQTMLAETNSYIQRFKTVYQRIQEAEVNVADIKLCIADRQMEGVHERRTNLPIVDEIAVLLVGDTTRSRDLVICGMAANEYTTVCETHYSYDPLQYPLMFPFGSEGYSAYLSGGQKNPISTLQYYKSLLMTRENNYLLYYRELLSVFLVDMYVKIESERMLYLKLHQTQLRSEQYGVLRDAVNNDAANLNTMGRLVVLPSSFTGSPRYYHEKQQDGMCYVRKYGSADLFITMTCNPRWKEIQDALKPHQQASHRHDIISRVFNLKVKCLVNLLKKQEVFGEVQAYMYSIEWQKRGLPHVHILLWLVQRLTSDRVDDVISAEIPSMEANPILHQIVKSQMIHGPCGLMNSKSPCMKDNRCTKRYPKSFNTVTCTNEDGYPMYRRRSPNEGGHTVNINPQFAEIDNRWVVPFNPLLLHLLEAHVNVEACHSVKAVKYLCKYIVKGSDLATVQMYEKKDERNEIEHFVNGRYVSSSEAAWRIFGFDIHDHFPTIIHLAVHLDNGQRVYYKESASVLQLAKPPETTLTQFFKLCQTDALARTLLYDEVPQYFTWNPSSKQFQKRKQGVAVPGFPSYFRTNAIGRVYTIHPSQIDCYYLRMLLFVVRGPQSYKDLLTFDNEVHSTFQKACEARGLLENDMEWGKCMSDALDTQSPSQIRHLFVLLLLYCQVTNPVQLYNEFKESMADDIRYRYQRDTDEVIPFTEEIYHLSLLEMDKIMQSYDPEKSLPLYGLRIDREFIPQLHIEEIREHRLIDRTDLTNEVSSQIPMLNSNQRIVYDLVMDTLSNQQSKLMFLDAPGGTGKTFLMNLIIKSLRRDGHIVIAVAASGIAATLLIGGKTVHSQFKVPIIMESHSTCNITKQSGLAKLLKEAKLIIWDECSMSHKHVFECVDRTLQFIRDDRRPMGGLNVLLGGDFRQTLPVVKRGTRADIVHASLKFSSLWEQVQLLPPLTLNMRLQNSHPEFANTLLQIGDNSFPHDGVIISYASFARSVYSTEELISTVWPDIANILTKTKEWISERTILTALNVTVDTINTHIMELIQTEEKVYYSNDKVMDVDQEVNYPIEFLNSIELPGIPAHKLCLKRGVPVMLMRNLRPPKLCNGTRLIITKLHNNLIEAIILTGVGKGDQICIPRIPLITSEDPFSFKRIQFPLKVCFAITINKAQGQSFDCVGVHLEKPCFSHGQLYVACSRTTNPENLYIYSEEESTANIVYDEVYS